MFKKEIIAHGNNRIIACDGKCNKAWGVVCRPSIDLDSENPDNVYFMPDDELPDAPEDPGTYEGGHGKPINAKSGEDMNKWCFRQCERCSKFKPGEEIKLKDFTVKRYNQPWTEEAKSDLRKDKLKCLLGS